MKEEDVYSCLIKPLKERELIIDEIIGDHTVRYQTKNILFQIDSNEKMGDDGVEKTGALICLTKHVSFIIKFEDIYRIAVTEGDIQFNSTNSVIMHVDL